VRRIRQIFQMSFCIPALIFYRSGLRFPDRLSVPFATYVAFGIFACASRQ